jgi:hypothetical protein
VPRVQAVLVAVLSDAAGDHFTSLIDVCRTGARLTGQFLPQVGQQLAFKSEDVEAIARVVWSTGHRCGVEFGTPLAAAEVDRLRNLAALKPQYDFKT